MEITDLRKNERSSFVSSFLLSISMNVSSITRHVLSKNAWYEPSESIRHTEARITENIESAALGVSLALGASLELTVAVNNLRGNFGNFTPNLHI